ncbi:amidohydrolase family protein [Chloroflexota bacterium]
MKLILDVHVHPFRRWPSFDGEVTKAGSELIDQSELLIHEMDAHGVGMAVALYGGCSNEQLQAMVRKYPKRLIAFCGWWHPTDCESSAAETIQKWLREPEFKGVGEVPIYKFGVRGKTGVLPELDMNEVRNVMDVVSEKNVPIHFCTGFYYTPPGFEPIPLLWKNPMLIDTIAMEYHDTPIIIGHCGGLYPPYNENALLLAYAYDNLYLDTSKAPTHVIEKAVSDIGASRLLFGTDWNGGKPLPFGPRSQSECHLYRRNLRVIEEARISDNDKDLILFENLKQLLHLNV